MRSKYRLTQYIFRFAEALFKQLESDQRRWGDEWRQRPKEGQEDRIYCRFEQYWVEYSRDQMPIPWLKIAGLAMIAWVRDNYPETAGTSFLKDKRYVDPD